MDAVNAAPHTINTFPDVMGAGCLALGAHAVDHSGFPDGDIRQLV